MAKSLLDYLHLSFLLSLLLLIIGGNLLVIFAFRSNPRLRTSTYKFLVSLAVSDLLVGSVSLPLWIYFSFSYHAYFPYPALVNFYGLFDIFSALASIFHLTAVTFERWIAICRPFYYTTLTRRFYLVSIALAWLMALVISALWPGYYIKGKDGFMGLQVYSVFLIVSGLFAPAVVITIVNVSIFRVAKSLVRNVPRPRQECSNGLLEIRRNIKRETKTALTLVVITALFCISWMPFFFMNLISPFCNASCNQVLLSPTFLTFVKWLHYSNSASNPLVYTLRDSEIRHTFASFARRICWLGLRRPAREEEMAMSTAGNCESTQAS
ncbi:D(1B) dopamine receptor [Nematostella vectensis]|uniref:D(1B) dopamine receptor n=1 Tax=Nematostella vectensis TaxID=45351 RepID=UPI00138FD29D|nr:D(1B) dopamine receptor [Nematostella vectensis]